MASKIWLWNGTKNNNTFFPHASRLLLCIRFVAVAFQSEEEVHWRRGPPVTYFGPTLDQPRADLAEKQQHLLGTMSTSSLPSFIKIHEAVLEKKSKMWKVYAGRRTEAMTIAHSSLRLRWAKKVKLLHLIKIY